MRTSCGKLPRLNDRATAGSSRLTRAGQSDYDLNGVPGLDHIEERDGELRIGALVRHKTCEKSELLRGRYRVLGDAAPQISDPLVRNRGTVCGSLAHADPQGDWGAVMLAARASVVAQGPDGERTIAIDDLIEGPFTTTLSADEETREPVPGGIERVRTARRSAA